MPAESQAASGRVGARIAFFGSGSLLSRELRAALEQRAFPTADVRLYDEAGPGALSEFDGEALVVTRPDEESILGLDIAFLCGTRSEMTPYLDWGSRRGFTAIDLSGAAAARAGVPLIHTELNPGSISPPLIASPHPLAHNLATVVSVARGVAPVGSLRALAFRPVSELGSAAIDELYQQTVGLLSFSEVPHEILDRQIAFNLVPSRGMQGNFGPDYDERAIAETSRLLDLPAERVGLTSALVPVFHGHTMQVTLRFDARPDVGDLEAAFESARGTLLVRELSDFSPVDLAGEERVAVADMRPDASDPCTVTLWSFCDNLKGGTALNAIRIAERVADRVQGAGQ